MLILSCSIYNFAISVSVEPNYDVIVVINVSRRATRENTNQLLPLEKRWENCRLPANLTEILACGVLFGLKTTYAKQINFFFLTL